MNRKAGVKLSCLSLIAILCLACSTIGEAQQLSGGTSDSSASAVGASSMTGSYSVGGNGTDRESAPDLSSRAGSRASGRTGMVNSRSTWMAGAGSTGGARAATSVAGGASSSGKSASSWVAGTGDFNLDRQQDGIWRELPGPGVQPNNPVTSAESNDLFAPLALTSKGAALIKGSGFSSSYASRLGTGFGIRGDGKPFAARRGFGNMKSRFSPRTGGFGSIGNGYGSKPATHVTPSTGTLNGPANDDMLRLDEGLGSGKTLGSGKLDSTGGTSH